MEIFVAAHLIVMTNCFFGKKTFSNKFQFLANALTNFLYNQNFGCCIFHPFKGLYPLHLSLPFLIYSRSRIWFIRIEVGEKRRNVKVLSQCLLGNPVKTVPKDHYMVFGGRNVVFGSINLQNILFLIYIFALLWYNHPMTN